VKFKNKV